MMRPFVIFWLVFYLLCLVFAWGASTANSGVRSPRLEAYLPTPVPVFCTTNKQVWSTETRPYFGGVEVDAFTFMEGAHDGEIHLGPYTCLGLRSTSDKAFPLAAQTLYHEWFHSVFDTTDEGETECLSLFIYRYALRHLWGLTNEVVQWMYHEAWLQHLLLSMIWPAYRGVCEYPQRDPVQ